MAGVSAWRINDVVAYDLMRDSATTLTARLFDSAPTGSPNAASALAEIAELRRAVLVVDGYDRAEVAALALRISSRVAELSGARS